jgi:hypothetical protein
VARDFDVHPKEKAEGGQRAPRRAAIPIDSGRPRINDGQPTDSDKAASGISWPGFWPRSFSGAGPVLLLGIALLCTLYPGLHKKNSTAANPKPEEQLRSDPTSQPSSTVQPIAKPSPIHEAVTAQSEGSIMPEQPSNAVSSLPGSPAAHYRPIKYEATHKKAFGGCTGQLELTSAALHFRCPHQDDLDIPVSSIASTHKDGVVLESGEKYHFVIANHTKGQVEMIFTLWLNRVRQSQQASGESSF